MIKAIIFDLDGALVHTEISKAKSYTRAAIELGQGTIKEKDVIEAFKAVVGRSRKEVAQNFCLLVATCHHTTIGIPDGTGDPARIINSKNSTTVAF